MAGLAPSRFGDVVRGLALAAGLLAAGSSSAVEILSSTYFGGPRTDWITDAVPAPDGGLLVAGLAGCRDGGWLPATAGRLQEEAESESSGYVCRFTPEGQPAWCTYLGGPAITDSLRLALGTEGSIAVLGNVRSPGMPVTPGAFQPTPSFDEGDPEHVHLDLFLAVLSADGTELLYSTYFGNESSLEEARGVAFDGDDCLHFSGSAYDAPPPLLQSIAPDLTQGDFAAKLCWNGPGLVYSTLVAGRASVFGPAVAATPDGATVVVGETKDPRFLLHEAFDDELGPGEDRDGYVTVIEPAGGALRFSTFLGGSDDDWIDSVFVDAAGFVHLGGSTESDDFPLEDAARDRAEAGSGTEGFLATLSPDGQVLSRSTLLGPGVKVYSLSLDEEGAFLLAGKTGFQDGRPYPAAEGGDFHDESDNYQATTIKLSPGGWSVTWSALFGGHDVGGPGPLPFSLDEARAVVPAPEGGAWVVGVTQSEDFPVADAFDGVLNEDATADWLDGFVMRLAPAEPPAVWEPSALDVRPWAPALHVRRSTPGPDGSGVAIGWEETMGGAGPALANGHFVVHEGSLASLVDDGVYDHEPVPPCLRDTASIELPLPDKDTYYVVTLVDDERGESSHGRDGLHRERPRAGAGCP